MAKAKKSHWKETLFVVGVIVVFGMLGAAISSYFWHNYGYDKLFSRNLDGSITPAGGSGN